MNSRDGISLIALVITIISMIILSVTIIVVGTSGIDTSIDARIKNEKSELEKAVVSRFADYSIDSDAYPLIGEEVSSDDLDSIDGINVENIGYIRRLGSSDLQSLSIKNTTGSTYIVDYSMGKVFGPIK